MFINQDRAGAFFFTLLVVISFSLMVSCLTDTGGDSDELANTYYNLGNAYSELERFEDAVEAYANSWRLDSDFSAAGYNLMRVYIFLEKYDEAEQLLNELLEEEPRNTIVLEAAGYLFHKRGDYDSALRYYNRVISTDSVNSNALYNTFLIYRSQGEQKAALDQLFKYLELNKDDYASLAVLASLYEELEQKNKAVESYQLFLEKEKSDEEKISEVQQSLAVLLIDMELYSDALELLNQLTSVEEPAAELLFRKSWVLLIGLEEYDSGLENLKSALEAGFIDKKLTTAMGMVEDALYHDEILKFLESKDLYDPALLIEEETVVPEEEVAVSNNETPALEKGDIVPETADLPNNKDNVPSE